MEKVSMLKDHLRAIEKPVEMIAHVRRMAELGGEDMEKFDKKLNELCESYHEKFAKMDDFEIALYGLKVIIEAGHGKDFVDKLMEDEE